MAGEEGEWPFAELHLVIHFQSGSESLRFLAMKHNPVRHVPSNCWVAFTAPRNPPGVSVTMVMSVKWQESNRSKGADGVPRAKAF